MTRTEHRMGSNYVQNHPWLYRKIMTDIFVDQLNAAGNLAGVLEADDRGAYFYLYMPHAETGGRIVGAVQVYAGAPNYTASDVVVRWFDKESKVGVFIKGELGAYFDIVAGWGYPGTYSRTQPNRTTETLPDPTLR